MDIGDRAQGVAELLRTLALRKHKQAVQAVEESLFCDDCEEEIQEARRRAAPGCRRCAFCQKQVESGV